MPNSFKGERSVLNTTPWGSNRPQTPDEGELKHNKSADYERNSGDAKSPAGSEFPRVATA